MGREKCLFDGTQIREKNFDPAVRLDIKSKTKQKKLRRRAQFCGKVKRRELSKHTRHRVQRARSEVFMQES